MPLLRAFTSGADTSAELVAQVAPLIDEFEGTELEDELAVPVDLYRPQGGGDHYSAGDLKRLFEWAIRWLDDNYPDVGVEIQTPVAQQWFKKTLEGSPLALALSERLALQGRAVALVEDGSIAGLEDLQWGKQIRQSTGDELARRLLVVLYGQGAQTIVVESDTQRRGDPHVTGQVAFIGDRVLRWAPITEVSRVAVALLASGSSGYPLVACVSQLDGDELGLAPGSDVSPASVDRLAQSTVALFASAYDAETYVVWLVTRADVTRFPGRPAPGRQSESLLVDPESGPRRP